MSLLLTFNKYTASEVLSFSIHHFYVTKYNQWECTSDYLRRNKEKMSAGKKTIEEKRTILLECTQRPR